jgi:competence protein ComEA
MRVMSSEQTFGRPLKAVLACLMIVLATSIGGKAAVRRTESTTAPEVAQGKPANKELTAKEEEERAAVVEETMDRACRMCHPIENITRMRRTVREWADVLTTMQGRGASATDEEFEAIHWYLNRYFGVVRVNTATVDELAAVLGLTAKDAQAIVEYRKAHGNFADLAALMKIEGIDKAKLEEQPDALRFN